MNIRTLRADEIEVRVQTVKENGCSVLLYKDARVDMNILDETFGIFGWQRTHEVINGNLFCNVSVYNEKTNQWITKQDVGTESMTEKEKGQASDSFKRACFNLGIGRELYTAPFVWINFNSSDTYKGNNGKVNVKSKFHVSKIVYNDNREITALEIKDDKGTVRYTLGKVSLDANDLLTEKYNSMNSTNTSTTPSTTPSTNHSTNHSTNTSTNTTTTPEASDDKCMECSAEIKPAVVTYSKRYYGRPLCLACQNKSAKIG